MFDNNSCMMPMEQDYYDVCTYAGDQQRFDLILELIKWGMRRNNYEPGHILMGMCIANDVDPKDSPEVIKLIRKNIDEIKAVYVRCVKDEISGSSSGGMSPGAGSCIGPEGKARDHISN